MTLPTAAPAAPASRRRVLKGLQVPQRDRARFEEIGDQEARGSAEQLQEVSNQAAPVLAPVDRGLEELGVADLLDLAQSAFLLESVDERLNGRVGNTFFHGQTVEDLPNGARPQRPALFEDSCFGSRKTGALHVPP